MLLTRFYTCHFDLDDDFICIYNKNVALNGSNERRKKKKHNTTPEAVGYYTQMGKKKKEIKKKQYDEKFSGQ